MIPVLDLCINFSTLGKLLNFFELSFSSNWLEEMKWGKMCKTINIILLYLPIKSDK